MHYGKKIISLGCAVVFAGSAGVAMADSVTYQADPTHTFANFSYDHMGLSRQTNTFNDTKGTLVIDFEDKTGQLDVEIDLRSVNTGAKVFDGHLQGEDFFDTEKYPTATFTSDTIVFDGDTPTAVEGDLTIKGITQPVIFDIVHFVQTEHPMMQKPAMGANAKTTVKRSDFNMDKYVPAVSDNVEITVSFEGIAAD